MTSTLQNKPNYAFILAAGKGTRLRPHTDTMPKPMVPINGRPILDYALEKLKNSNVNNITINTNYLGDRIKNYTESIHDLKITLSPETEHLETGGGVLYALDTMENQPFYLINGDALWTDGENTPTLDRLAEAWNPDIMDILLLMQPVKNMNLTQGVGDYDLKDDGKAVRSMNKTGTYMFGGIRITKPNIFDDRSQGAFSFLELMDKAEKEGKLYGLIHDGDWYHISTPEDLNQVDKAFKQTTPQAKTA
jgi:MurNAc alpha-1-phosphate uridylyltransferase